MHHRRRHSNNKFSGTLGIFLSSILAVFVIIALAGCGDNATGPGIGNGNGENGNGNGNDVPGENEVWMVGQSFTPSNLEVEVGTTVTWENRSSETHTVTSGSDGSHDEIFDSGSVPPGEDYSFTFDETGTFDYFCIPHPNMTGTITVVD